MSGYIGTQPVPQATQTRDTFTATAGQTSFATGGYSPSFLDVYLNGVHLQNGTDYVASNGSDVVLTTGAAADDVLEVVAYSTFELVNPTFSGTVTADGLTVDTDTLHVDSTNNRVGIGELLPSSPLHVNGGGTNAVATFESTDATTSVKFVDSDQTQGVFVGAKGDDFYIQAGGSEKVRVKNDGNVTINSGDLDVTGTVKSTVSTTGDNNFQAVSTGGGNYRIYPDDATTANPTWLHQSNSSEEQAWVIGGVERMRLDAAGNLAATSFSGDGSALTGIYAGPSTSHGAVGTYAVFSCTQDNIGIGSTVAGSKLRRKNDEGDGFGTISGTTSTSTASGTWRVMGNHRTLVTSSQSGSVYYANLFLRIS